MKALLVKKPWIDEILSGRKTWEIRGSATAVRGKIALVESGTGHVVGTCEITDVLGPLSFAELRRNASKHRAMRGLRKLPYKRTHAWVLAKARRFKTPVPYNHPQGAVIWVNLSGAVAARVGKAR